KSEIDPRRFRDPTIYVISQPALLYFLLNYAHIPAVPCPKVAATSGKTETAFCFTGAECSVRPAYRAALSEGNYIVRFYRLGLRFLALSTSFLRRLFRFYVLIRNWDSFRFLLLLLDLRQGLGKPLGLVCQNVLGLHRRGGKRDRIYQRHSDSVSTASSTPAGAVTRRPNHSIKQDQPRNRHVQPQRPSQ